MRLVVSANPVADDLPGADALRRDPDASYERAAAATPVTDAEREVLSVQLGRPARGENAVAHRCVYGLPTVARVAPRLEDGTPFPTTFWLTCPVAVGHVGGLEADGAMDELRSELGDDAQLAAGYTAAHQRYLAFREQLGPALPERVGSAGGMPERIKCLHVHLAQHLATGDNPIGARTFDRIAPMTCRGPCVPGDLLAAAYGPGPPPEADADAWRTAAPPAERPHAGGGRR